MRNDHFSRRAADYAAFRPTYPPELFAWLARLTPARRAAWDCATGSGQAAIGLADHFAHVEATDASASQIAHGRPHPRVSYRQAPAEASGLADDSVQLVAVAQALHWLDVDAFYAEAERVLVPGGVLATWSYGSASLDDPALSALFATFEHETMGPWWPPERRHILEAYRTIPFPFREVAPPAVTLRRDWTLDELVGYVSSWSAVDRYLRESGDDPVSELRARLATRWGDPARRRAVRWPLALRVGLTGERGPRG